MSTTEPLYVGLMDEARSGLEGVHLSDQGGGEVSRGPNVEVLQLVEDVARVREGGNGVNDGLQLGWVLDEVLDDEAGAWRATREPLAGICVKMEVAVEIAQANGKETDSRRARATFIESAFLTSRTSEQ